MSDFTQAALISGGIFVVVMARGYGRRGFDRGAVLMPIAMVAGFGWFYLRDAPITSATDWVVYGIAAVIGLAFAAAATAVTGMERDTLTGKVMTITGPVFAAVWLIAVLARLGFVWAVTDVPSAREHFGAFMIAHHIDLGTVAPFFLIWALTMVVVRMIALKVREHRLPAPAASPVALVA